MAAIETILGASNFDFDEALPDFLLAKLQGAAPSGRHPLARDLFRSGASVAEAALQVAENREIALGAPNTARVHAAFTESDFPAIFANQAAVLVRSAFAAQARHRAFCRRIELANFKETEIAQIHPPAGAIKEVVSGEELSSFDISGGAGAKTRLRVYAGTIALSDAALLGDELEAFAAALGAYGITFSTLEAALVYSALEDNGNLNDDSPWFNAGAGNLLTGAALTGANLGAAMAALRKQPKDDAGTPAEADAVALICSAEDEYTARELVRGVTIDGSPQVRVFASSRIAGGAGARWYLSANPQQFPTVGIFTLRNRPEPSAPLSRWNFETDDFEIRLRFDVAAAPLSRVGIVRCEA